jgi:hypothetical protein
LLRQQLYLVKSLYVAYVSPSFRLMLNLSLEDFKLPDKECQLFNKYLIILIFLFLCVFAKFVSGLAYSH